MLVVRCKSCGKELSSDNGKSQCCGCPNMTSIVGDKITAVDLSQAVIVKMRVNEKSNQTSLSSSDVAWQESRRQRKVRKMDFEVRYTFTQINNLFVVLARRFERSILQLKWIRSNRNLRMFRRNWKTLKRSKR